MSSNVVIKQSDDYELIAMAWHEASHTIVGLYNFINIENIYVVSEKHDHGKTSYENFDLSTIDNKSLAKILLIHEIQTFYAGLIGEKIYYREICGSDKFPMHLRIGSSEDIQSAAKLITKYNLAESGSDRVTFKKQIQKDTKEILQAHWDDVRLIAHVLYRYKEMTAEDLKYFLTRKSESKGFWLGKFKDIKKIYSSEDLDEKGMKEIFLRHSIII